MKNKFTKIVITAVLIAGMVGCNKPAESEDSSSAESESAFVGEVIYNGSTTSETFLTGLDGKAVNAAEITRLYTKDSNAPAVLDESSLERAECDGFAYAFKPDDDSKEFIRINVGDKFGGLTVKSARAVFSANNMNGAYYEGSEITFDGEITLNGTLNIPMEVENYPYDFTQEMFLEPKSFPLSVMFEAQNGNYQPMPEPPAVYIGNYRDCQIDLDGMTDGYRYPAEITVSALSAFHGIGGAYGHIKGELENVRKLGEHLS